jgi:uncharacterized protein YdaU (DUF1376 family)
MAQFPSASTLDRRISSPYQTSHRRAAGAYLLLLMEAGRRPTCSLADDDGLLARLACMSFGNWLLNRETVMAFWKYDERRKEWSRKEANERTKICA